MAIYVLMSLFSLKHTQAPNKAYTESKNTVYLSPHAPYTSVPVEAFSTAGATRRLIGRSRYLQMRIRRMTIPQMMIPQMRIPQMRIPQMPNRPCRGHQIANPQIATPPQQRTARCPVKNSPTGSHCLVKKILAAAPARPSRHGLCRAKGPFSVRHHHRPSKGRACARLSYLGFRSCLLRSCPPRSCLRPCCCCPSCRNGHFHRAL